jgi:hypothetical protein
MAVLEQEIKQNKYVFTPEYEARSCVFAREIRTRLAQSFSERPALAPVAPESLEYLVQKSRSTVSERWRQTVSDLVRDEATKWAASLGSDEYAHARSILANPDLLEQKLAIRQFSDLDALRQIHPDDWYSLVRASMERQQTETNLLYTWVRDMPDSDVTNLGLSRLELLIALEIATKTGPLINETYMQQMHIIDDPVLRGQFIFGDGDGSKYLYQKVHDDGSIEKISYTDMFPDSWPQIVSNIWSLAYKTTMMVASGQLPPSYAALAGLLDQTAHAYGSRETDVTILKNTWLDLLTSSYDFIAAQCPVDLSVQFNSYLSSYDGNVDAEIRVGIETPKTKVLLDELLPYRDIARLYAKKYDETLAKPTVPVRIRIQNLLYGAGSNVYWRTQGEAADGTLVCYLDSTQDSANLMQRPIFEKVFGTMSGKEDMQQFFDLYTKTVVCHELGHTVLSSADAFIEKRTGAGTGGSMIEELKADVMAYTIAWERMRETGNFSQSQQMLEMLVTYCLDYIVNRDSTDGYGTSMYAGGGAVILSALLDSGVLVKDGDRYRIIDEDRGFSVLKNISDDICRVYADPDTTPEKIEAWAKELGAARQNIKLAELLTLVQKN